jgi:drug/metabolite transporter (DMT)-like permease
MSDTTKKRNYMWIILSVVAAVAFSVQDVFVAYVINQKKQEDGDKPVVHPVTFLLVYGLTQLLVIIFVWMLVREAHDFSGIFKTKDENDTKTLKMNNLLAIAIGSVFSVGAYFSMVYAFKLVNDDKTKNIGTVKTIMAIQPILVLIFICLITWKKENKLVIGEAPQPSCRDFAGAAIVIFGVFVASS